MGKEPCWGRGLIIKQLGNLSSIAHLALVPSGAGRGNFQNTVAMPRKTRSTFKIWRGDGDASEGLAHLNLGRMLPCWVIFGSKRNHPSLSWVTRKDRWGLEDRVDGLTSSSWGLACTAKAWLPSPTTSPLFTPLKCAQQVGITHRPSHFPPLLHLPGAGALQHRSSRARLGRHLQLWGNGWNGCAVLGWHQLSNIMQGRQGHYS